MPPAGPAAPIPRPEVIVRNTRPEDFAGITGMCSRVYAESPPWKDIQLASHLRVFPEGQFVALLPASGKVVGMASSLIVYWDDYDGDESWRDFTEHGMFTNHDPERGHTLYAAEVMVDPDLQGAGIGTKLYTARFALARRLGLWRIRAGARLRGYHKYADSMSADEYAEKVAHGEIWDPTVSFQMKRGFRVFGVVEDYLHHDSESMGHAALIEWLNDEAIPLSEAEKIDPRFR